MVSFDESDSFDDDSGIDWSDSGSTGTCNFPFRFDGSVSHVRDSVGRVDEYLGHVSGVGSSVYVLTGIKSIGDVVPFVVFVPKGVESKGG